MKLGLGIWILPSVCVCVRVHAWAGEEGSVVRELELGICVGACVPSCINKKRSEHQ